MLGRSRFILLGALVTWIGACSTSSPGPFEFGASGSTAGGGNGGTGSGKSSGGRSNQGGGTDPGIILDTNASTLCNGKPCTEKVNTGPYCGDKKISAEIDEACDDGNRIGGDGCSGICKVEPNWECPEAGQPCKSLIICGNGARQITEECDDGNKSSDDGCDPSCKVESGWFCGSDGCKRLAGCGDGRIANGESCDLGDENGKDKGCDAACRQQDGWVCRPLPVGCKHQSICGNSKVETGEDCDDGNTDSGDGCNNLCRIEGSYWDCPNKDGNGGACKDNSRCGNGVLEKQELCDDGNNNDGDGCSKDCKTESGWQCRKSGVACVPLCGDSKITGTESCDDGNSDSGDGCSVNCAEEPGWSCTKDGKSTCTKSVCGNGKQETGESCDKGKENGLFYGDGSGCSKTCTKEPKCRDGAKTRACDVICGDGSREEGEDCDDGNQVSGDGCSDQCKKEEGFTCEDTDRKDTEACPSGGGECLVLPIVFRDFDSQKETTGHPDFFYMGATSGGTKTICVPNASGRTQGKSGSCPGNDSTALCLGLVSESLGDGGKPLANTGRTNGLTCACQFTDWDKTGLNDSNPDATTCESGGSGTIYTLKLAQVKVIQSADSFKQWYSDSDKSTKFVSTLELAQVGSTNQYQYSSSEDRTVYDDLHDIFTGRGVTSLESGFFPEEMEMGTRVKTCNLWPYWTAKSSCVGNQWDPRANDGGGSTVENVEGVKRNFYFTSEVRYLFRYVGGETLEFFGDDDVWVFINGHLVLDLGAPHERLLGKVTLSKTGTSSATTETQDVVTEDFTTVGTTQKNDNLGMTVGKTYEIAVFHADRHPRESNYRLTLSGFSTKLSVCKPSCGDGRATGAEECDNGDKNQDGLYDGCTKSCQWGPFCGDGEKNGNEECDDGKNTTITSSGDSKACGPGCKLPPRCGDGKIQSGEQCDDGTNNTSKQCGGCSESCKTNPYCGDGHTDEQCGEKCDDGVNIGGYSYCKSDCTPDARCGDGQIDKEYGETCDLGDKNGQEINGKVECTATCGVPAVCGDNVVTPPEQCDNGADNDGRYGGCTADCKLAPYCGDGVKTSPQEECDYGEANSPPDAAVYGGCMTNCKLGPRCGDGVRNGNEDCDEGVDTPSCNANCVGKIK